jgi:hypothetical protein
MICKPVYFEGRNIDETWFNGLKMIYKYGRRYVKTDGSGAGKDMLEFDYATGRILKPVEFSDAGVMLPLAPTVPDGCPGSTTDAQIQEYFVTYIMDGTCAPNEHYKYGTFIVGGQHSIQIQSKYHGNASENTITFAGSTVDLGPTMLNLRVPNQLQWCIDHFLNIMEDGKPNYKNNHCMVQVGYPESQMEYDKPFANETERGTSPCLRVIDFKLVDHEGEWYLCAYVYFRAWNLYAAWPENLGGISLLMYYVAEQLSVYDKVHVGELFFASKALNIYADMLDAVRMRVGPSNFEIE